jgi:hypothetical protein
MPATAYSDDSMIFPERKGSNVYTGNALEVLRGVMDTEKVTPGALLSCQAHNTDWRTGIPAKS